MDGMLYYGVLFVIVVISFMFYQNNSNRMAVIILLLGAYIIYSHETGYSATDLKNEMIDSLDESAQEYSKRHGAEGFDEESYSESVK